jgi:hypothetical protein
MFPSRHRLWAVEGDITGVVRAINRVLVPPQWSQHLPPVGGPRTRRSDGGFLRWALEVGRVRRRAQKTRAQVTLALSRDSNTEPGDGSAAALDEKRKSTQTATSITGERGERPVRA